MKIKLSGFGDDSADGTVISWFVEEGAEVKEGQLLLEIEADKVLLKIDSPVNGILRTIYRGEGSIVCSNDELGEIKEKEKC